MREQEEEEEEVHMVDTVRSLPPPPPMAPTRIPSCNCQDAQARPLTPRFSVSYRCLGIVAWSLGTHVGCQGIEEDGRGGRGAGGRGGGRGGAG